MQHHKVFSSMYSYYLTFPWHELHCGCGQWALIGVWHLFEGGVNNNAQTLAAGDDYSRAATIRGRRLFDEIRYVLTILIVLTVKVILLKSLLQDWLRKISPFNG